MQKKVLIVTCSIIAVIFFASLTALIRMNLGEPDKKTAQIYQNGTLLYTLDLNTVTDSYELTVTGNNNEYNVILVEQGQISMKEASCPDKLCVHMGKIRNASLPVTCLPNKVVICIVPSLDNKNDADTPDAIVY